MCKKQQNLRIYFYCTFVVHFIHYYKHFSYQITHRRLLLLLLLPPSSPSLAQKSSDIGFGFPNGIRLFFCNYPNIFLWGSKNYYFPRMTRMTWKTRLWFQCVLPLGSLADSWKALSISSLWAVCVRLLCWDLSLLGELTSNYATVRISPSTKLQWVLCYIYWEGPGHPWCSTY